jgi:hypothetical protein
MTVEKKAFEHSIRPWIDEYSAMFEPCCTDIQFDWADYSLVRYGDYEIPCGPNGHLLGQYLLFHQIQLFFKATNQNECTVFAIEYPI